MKCIHGSAIGEEFGSPCLRSSRHLPCSNATSPIDWICEFVPPSFDLVCTVSLSIKAIWPLPLKSFFCILHEDPLFTTRTKVSTISRPVSISCGDSTGQSLRHRFLINTSRRDNVKPEAITALPSSARTAPDDHQGVTRSSKGRRRDLLLRQPSGSRI